MSEKEKLVYVPMAVDTVHPGHLNIIKVASGLGKVMIGLFTDEAIASYKKIPVMSYEQRKTVIENIKGVDMVVRQESRDYEPNLRKYKPDYMVHGTDWRDGPLAAVRARAIEVMAEWGGSVVEPEYTKGVSSSSLHQAEERDGKTPLQKTAALRRLFSLKAFSYIAGVYNGQTARIAESASAKGEDGVKKQFDALWLDMAGIASAKGLTEESSLELSDCFSSAAEIGLVSGRPLIIELQNRNQETFLKRAEQAGISAVSVRDSDAEKRSEVIAYLKNHRNYSDMMVFVSLDAESPSLEKDWENSGAEGIVLQLNTADLPAEKIERLRRQAPVLVLLPENSSVTVSEVREAGASGVISQSVFSRRTEKFLQDLAGQILR